MPTKRLCCLSLSILLCQGWRSDAAIVFSDAFAYPDGVLQSVSAGRWVGHSGTTNQVDASNGVLNLTGSESQDVNATLDGQPYTATNHAVLYASFKIKCATLPSASGGYFAHFKDAGGGFRGRIWALTGGAATNSFRLGISSSSGSAPALVHPTDLRRNTEYTVVMRLIVTNSAATLWVSPTAESDPSVTSETGAALSITSYAFRQVSGMGVMTIDDLLVGTDFADVVPPVNPPPVDHSPIITLQPAGLTMRQGEAAVFKIEGQGAEPLSYQWRFKDADLIGATNQILTLTNVTVAQQGDYRAVVSNVFGTATSAAATLTVNTPPEPPSILTQPLSLTVTVGQQAAFAVSARGSEPLHYQWRVNGTDVGGATTSALILSNVTVNHSGRYSVQITNAVGAVESASVSLQVELPPPPAVTNIAYLRSLVDPVNFLPVDTVTLFSVEGVVTTHTNLTTSADALFYLQDATAGIAVFWRGGGGAVPKAGDLVRVTAPLAHFSGLLELAPNTAAGDHAVTVISSGNPLPEPAVLELAWQTNAPLMELNEGKFMVVSNVFLDLANPTFRTGGENVTMTNANGEKFVLRIDSRTDIGGQPKPRSAVAIFGVLGQSDTSNPRTSGYQLIPTRGVDIVSAAEPPAIWFTNYLANLVRPGDALTNTFTEHALRPGEQLTLLVLVSDLGGQLVSLSASSQSLPVSAAWTTTETPDVSPTASFTFTPTPADAGSNYIVTLQASNRGATNRATWTIYVPTLVEQQIIVSEFLANPATTNTAPHFNPLHRTEPAPSPSAQDEFVELVNASERDVDLQNWTVSDSTQVRHRFAQSLVLPASGAVVVYGGPARGFAPVLPVAAVPASEGSSGLGLNNSSGDAILIRNADGHLISRVVYGSASASGSLTRFPDLNGPFVAHSSTATNAASPGTQPDGRPFGVSVKSDLAPLPFWVTVSLDGGRAISLQWNAEPGRTYSVLWSASVEGPFVPVTTGRSFADGLGSYADAASEETLTRFYRISSP